MTDIRDDDISEGVRDENTYDVVTWMERVETRFLELP